MNDSSEPRTTLLGATVTPGAAARDALLAGGFTMLTVWVAYGTALAGVIGLAGGGFLGATLHLVPAVARKGDSALGRILIRTGTGAIAGAGVAGFPRWLLLPKPAFLIGTARGQVYALCTRIRPDTLTAHPCLVVQMKVHGGPPT